MSIFNLKDNILLKGFVICVVKETGTEVFSGFCVCEVGYHSCEIKDMDLSSFLNDGI